MLTQYNCDSQVFQLKGVKTLYWANLSQWEAAVRWMEVQNILPETCIPMISAVQNCCYIFFFYYLQKTFHVLLHPINAPLSLVSDIFDKPPH